MAVIALAPLFEARCVERGAVGHDDIVAAIGRGVPDGLVLAHEEGRDPRGEATEWWRRDGLWGGFDGGEGGVGGVCGDVVPYSGVG